MCTPVPGPPRPPFMPCVWQLRQVSSHRMLERLQLDNVGPAPAMALELAPRINLITGDNGLGKSFLLDVAWWALTRRWPRDLNPRLTSGYPARPTNVREPATLGFTVTTATDISLAYESTYSPLDEAWPGRAGRPWIAGLVVYAHADGGFSVWESSQELLAEEGRRRHSGTGSRLRVFCPGSVERTHRSCRRQPCQGVQGTPRRLVKLDPRTRNKRRVDGASPRYVDCTGRTCRSGADYATVGQ